MHFWPNHERKLWPFRPGFAWRLGVLVNPLGIDASQPQIQWIVDSPQHVRGAKQTSYQILAASAESALNAGRGDSSSRHHPFGACSGSYFYGEIRGIRTDPSGSGFEKIVIRPVVGNLQWAKATCESFRGPITTEWKQVENRFDLRLTIPPNTTARVELPAPDFAAITEGGVPLDRAAGVKMVRIDGGRAIVAVESGEYAFSVKRQSAGTK